MEFMNFHMLLLMKVETLQHALLRYMLLMSSVLFLTHHMVESFTVKIGDHVVQCSRFVGLAVKTR